MELKPGYKQTEVGVIPEDWDVSPLNGKVTITHGFAFASQHFSAHGPFRLTTPGHFFERGGFRDIGEKQKYFIGPVPTDYILKSGDMIVAMTEQSDGLLGSAAFIPGTENYLHNQRLGRVRTLSPEVDLGYLYYIFNSTGYRIKVRETAAGTKVKHTSPGKLLQIPVQIAPIAEQRAIAKTLNDLEALLDLLEDLIAKKRNIKQAAMQELLTGKRRLPGFEGEWEVKRLGELGEFVKGSGVKKDEATSGDLPCVRYGEIYTHHENYISEFKSHISTTVASRATNIRQGDVLFAGSGETKEEIGKAVALSHPVRAFAGGDIVILRQQDADALFLGYRLNAIDVSRQKAGLGQGDAVVHISADALSKISVSLPERAEQEAIANILYEMDTELRRLQLRLAKTQALKQGMMQQLLTGKIRLK